MTINQNRRCITLNSFGFYIISQQFLLFYRPPSELQKLQSAETYKIGRSLDLDKLLPRAGILDYVKHKVNSVKD